MRTKKVSADLSPVTVRRGLCRGLKARGGARLDVVARTVGRSGCCSMRRLFIGASCLPASSSG